MPGSHLFTGLTGVCRPGPGAGKQGLDALATGRGGRSEPTALRCPHRGDGHPSTCVINHMDRWHFDFVDDESDAFALQQLRDSDALLASAGEAGSLDPRSATNEP